ncbi:MAG: ABC transporter permease [Nanoarchaeota archaeon]|nr:ABC transporter permease [Nanoarchaeota archaeon]MBU1103457.1 ABC transporter permease [Nanoarchaeota archaeon]
MVISKELINYSLKNLWQSRGRSFMTILSIFVGITTIFIFISFGWGLYDYTESFQSSSSVDKVMIQAKGMGAPGLDDTFKLTDDDLEAIEKVAGVFEASGSYFRAAQVEKGTEQKYIFFISYDPKKPIMMELSNIDIEEGRWLRNGEAGRVIAGYNYLIPGRIFPDQYALGDMIKIDGKKMRIVGFLEEVGNPADDSQIYITNDYMEELYADDNLSYGMLIARVDVKNIDEIIAKIEKNLRKERGLEEGQEDFYVQSFQDLIESFAIALNVIIAFVILIALISVVVSAVNTANTMVTSVLERIKEIGIMKSVGAQNSEIFKVFLFESAFLGFVAGVLGVALGWLVSYIAGVILDNFGWGFLSPHFSASLFLGCIAFATLTGAISGAWPAWSASKIRPVDALRYE